MKLSKIFLMILIVVTILLRGNVAYADIFLDDFSQSPFGPLPSGSDVSLLSLTIDILGVPSGSATGNMLQFDAMTIESAIVPAKMDGIPLVYPNPFRFSDTPKICYRLTANMNIQFRFFNMLGHALSTREILAGLEGGAKGYNRLPITASDLGGEMGSGIYFYLVFNSDTKELLGKGSLALKP